MHRETYREQRLRLERRRRGYVILARLAVVGLVVGLLIAGVVTGWLDQHGTSYLSAVR